MEVKPAFDPFTADLQPTGRASSAAPTCPLQRGLNLKPGEGIDPTSTCNFNIPARPRSREQRDAEGKGTGNTIIVPEFDGTAGEAR